MYFWLFLSLIPMESALAGKYFWNPRMGVDAAFPTTESSLTILKLPPPVIYHPGISMNSFASNLPTGKKIPHLNPLSASFYTNSYRWALRYISLIPLRFGRDFCEAHKVWKRRFFYMDELVPKWMRKLFPYVKDEEWEKEIKQLQRFKKYAEPVFGRFYRHPNPNKVLRDFRSRLTTESEEPEDLNDTI